jgi:glycyl-tRNA synthetase beta subunit
VLGHSDRETEAYNLPSEALRCVQALEKFRDSDDFGGLAQAAKRVRNILTKSATAEVPGNSVDISLLEIGPEKELWDQYLEAYNLLEVSGRFRSGVSYDYEKVFAYITGFYPIIQRYFEVVRVMTDGAAVRSNRLTLLSVLDQQIFSKFVEMSEIVPGTPPIEASTPKGNEPEG